MTTTSHHLTLQHIAGILSFKDNQCQLAEQFKTSVDWDHMVRLSSQHLMLPALYSQLKNKALLSYIPTELALYLEEIARLNSNRNIELYNEAKIISNLFEEAQIEHVFIKGAAIISHLAKGDIGTRMIGDLDIVIAAHQLLQAFNLLKDHGYTKTISFNYTPKNYRHLPRQINAEKLGAIELHREVLIHDYSTLININDLLKHKQKIQGLYVPRQEDSIKIAIYTTQINDHAHTFGNLHLKAIYDCLLLNLHSDTELIERLSAHKQANTFLELSGLYFPSLKPTITKRRSKGLRSYYFFKLKNPKLGGLIQRASYAIFIHSKRIKLILNNKSYRGHLLKKKIYLKQSDM